MTVCRGELVRYGDKIWTVKGVWDTNTEGKRVDLERTRSDGTTDRLTAAIGDVVPA